MGFSFTLALARFLFPAMPSGTYVHYPTISADMVASLYADANSGMGVNAGTGRGIRGVFKRLYWGVILGAYGWIGSWVDVVMVNSSWTLAHMRAVWGHRQRARRGLVAPYFLPRFGARRTADDIRVVFPPVPVGELKRQIAVSRESEAQRDKVIVYIAQFRPEKNHGLIMGAFAALVRRMAARSSSSDAASDMERPRPRLVLIGSIRGDRDKTQVYALRLLAHELGIEAYVDFVLDAAWPQVLHWLRHASVGANGMWNEHFGISIVEYQAAGLISVVHNSGGPKLDIVVDYNGGSTGKSFSPYRLSYFSSSFSFPSPFPFSMG
jgi:alpha-1,2-mannosyltransferase